MLNTFLVSKYSKHLIFSFLFVVTIDILKYKFSANLQYSLL